MAGGGAGRSATLSLLSISFLPPSRGTGIADVCIEFQCVCSAFSVGPAGARREPAARGAGASWLSRALPHQREAAE